MRRLPGGFRALTVLLAFAAIAAAQEAPKPEAEAKHGRLLLVSLDGMRPEVIRDERFKMPVLREVAANGVAAKKVIGVFPTLTYPAHATIVTGCRPARHGVVNNTVFDSITFGKRWYWDAAHLRATPLWDAAHRAGLKTAALRWPCTVGAAIDFHIPEIFGVEPKSDHWALVRERSTPGLLDEVWGDPPKNVMNEEELDERATEAAAKIIELKKPDLFLIHLVQADGAQHAHGRDDERVAKAFANLDELLARLLKALDTAGVRARTNVIVTGDHGFLDVHTAVRPNVILREAGFQQLDGTGKVAEWTAAAQTGGGSAAIYLRDPSDRVTAERVLATFRAAAAGRMKGVLNLLDRDALDREEAFPGALCALEAEPGYGFDQDPKGAPLGPSRVRGTHGYLPSREELATGFVAAGPGLAKGRTVPVLRQIDVAPLAAHLLGVDLGPGVQGQLVPGLLAKEKQGDERR